ncbi:putative phosphoglucomutase (alpha-D-glucose-1,6-bisphosphate-dependent) [Helianthus annuus]|nr:putative phosphoglucomutase (alpha-D-glucose-1,6-bisphosphate-dependent) [Helianthus annuus]
MSGSWVRVRVHVGLVFSLSGTGVEGAIIRLYIEQYEKRFIQNWKRFSRSTCSSGYRWRLH